MQSKIRSHLSDAVDDCLMLLMIMLVGLIDSFTSKINCLLCALQNIEKYFQWYSI
jgi:hypothetical protein